MHEVAVRPGDIIVLATDGVFDNLFDDEIGRLLADAALRGGGEVDVCDVASGKPPSAQRLAELIATEARTASLQRARRTPFEVGAAEAGHQMPGGKLDDVSVICVRVLSGMEEGGAHCAPPMAPPHSRL